MLAINFKKLSATEIAALFTGAFLADSFSSFGQNESGEDKFVSEFLDLPPLKKANIVKDLRPKCRQGLFLVIDTFLEAN